MKRAVTLVLGVKLGLLGASFYFDQPPSHVVEAAPAQVVEEVSEEPEMILIEVEIKWTEDRIKEEVWKAAARYNTFPERMWAVISECENISLDHKMQSHIPDPTGPNNQEDSWGLAQFHLPSRNITPSGETITKEMAQDPTIALDAMAWHFSEGRAPLWSCYRLLYW